MAQADKTPITPLRRALIASLALTPVAGAVALPAIARGSALVPIAKTPDADAIHVLVEQAKLLAARREAAVDRQDEAEEAKYRLNPRPNAPTSENIEEWREHHRLCRTWEAENDRHWNHVTGYTEAEAQAKKLVLEFHDLAGEIANIPAVSLAGLVAKAAYLNIDDLNLHEYEADPVMESIIDDLLRMAKESTERAASAA